MTKPEIEQLLTELSSGNDLATRAAACIRFLLAKLNRQGTGRKPSGKHPMSNKERQQRKTLRAKARSQGLPDPFADK